MKLYKLTNSKHQSYNHTLWGENVTHKASGSPEQDLCSDGWLHAYESPELAVLLDPIHANFGEDSILWEAEGEIGKRDHQLKVGCRELTTLKIIPKPKITIEQRCKFAILCAKTVYAEPSFTAWADSWINGTDRSAYAADAAVAAARAAARAVRGAARAARGADINLVDIARAACS